MENLIKKLGEKWADFKYAVERSKVSRKVAGLVLAGAMAFPMSFSASACEFVVHKNPNGDIVVTPGGNQETPGNQQENPGSQDNPSGPTKPEPVEPVEPDYSMYSDILQTVLTSEYYNDIIKKAQNGELNHAFNGVPSFDAGQNLTEPIPYRFLHNEGADIESIQLDKIKVDTMSYTANKKDLYLKVNIIQPNQANPYITQYLLKYKINEKEYNDLTMLTKLEYFQAGFFIQELDNQREPEVVSKFNIYEDSYTSLLERLTDSKKLSDSLGSNKLDNITITNCTTEKKDYVLDLIIMKKNNTYKSLYDTKTTTMHLVIYEDAIPSYTNNIFAFERPLYMYFKEVGEAQNITCFTAYRDKIKNNLIEKIK